MRFAQAMTIDAGDIPAEVAAEFVELFTPQERVEIVIVASAMGMLNKINDSLRVPLERIRTAGKLTAGGVAALDPNCHPGEGRDPSLNQLMRG